MCLAGRTSTDITITLSCALKRKPQSFGHEPDSNKNVITENHHSFAVPDYNLNNIILYFIIYNCN